MDIWLIYIFIANNMVEESYLYKEKDYVYIVAILNIYKEMYVNIIYVLERDSRIKEEFSGRHFAL